MKSRKSNNVVNKIFEAMFGGMKNSYRLTSGYIKPNRKKRNRISYVKQGQGKPGMRGHDGTMHGPFRSRGFYD